MRRLALLVVLLAACSGADPAGSGPPGRVVLEWYVSQALWGEERLTIDESGLVKYHFTSADSHVPPRHRAARLSEAQVNRLGKMMQQRHCCQLKSHRDGIPDEGQPSLRLDFPLYGDLRCQVSLWDGEWRDRQEAAACSLPVENLRKTFVR
jgi:hypothetical protein